MSNSKLAELIPDYPKMIGALDDLHNMSSYIGDLRIIVILFTVTAYLGGIIFLVYRFTQKKGKKKSKPCCNNSNNNNPNDRLYNYDDRYFSDGQKLYAKQYDVEAFGRPRPVNLPAYGNDMRYSNGSTYRQASQTGSTPIKGAQQMQGQYELLQQQQQQLQLQHKQQPQQQQMQKTVATETTPKATSDTTD